MTPDEVRMMDNRFALLFIRGERPIMDEKCDLLKHPYVKDTADGDAPPYEHGTTENAVATIALELFPIDSPMAMEPDEMEEYELLSDEEIETFFKEDTSDEEAP